VIPSSLKMMNRRHVVLSIIFLFFLINVNSILAITENFSLLPNENKTFDVVLNKNQKVFFQIFVNGGENDDVRLKITDSDTNFVYFNGVIREDKQNTDFASVILPAHKSEISNDDADSKNLTFTFDNSFSTSGNKNVDFSYAVLTNSGAYFEQTSFWSWIYDLLIIILVIIIVIIAIIIVIKKLKNKNT